MVRLGLSEIGGRGWRRASALATAVVLSIALNQESAMAQGTIGAGATSGVSVDAEGVLRRTTVQDPTGDLSRQRLRDYQVPRQFPLGEQHARRRILHEDMAYPRHVVLHHLRADPRVHGHHDLPGQQGQIVHVHLYRLQAQKTLR